MEQKPLIKRAARRSRDIEALRRRIRPRRIARCFFRPKNIGVLTGVLSTAAAFALAWHGRPLVDRLNLPDSQRDALKQLVAADPRFGAKTAIVAMRPEERPRFLVVANLLNARFNVRLEAEAQDLLGSFGYKREFSIQLHRGYALTPAFTVGRNAPLFPGHYRLELDQPDTRLASASSYTFFNGMNEAQLEAQLRRRRADLRVQAQDELADIEKLRARMESEFNALYSALRLPSRLPSSQHHPKVPTDERWRELSRLAKDVLSAPQEKVFYAHLFKLARGAFEELTLLKQVYDEQERGEFGETPPKNDAKVRSLAEQLGPQLFELKSKILVAQAVARQNDFPSRE